MSTPSKTVPQKPIFSFKAIMISLASMIALYSAFWAIGQKTIKKEILKSLERIETQGRTLNHEGVSLSGFPASFSIRMAAPVFQDHNPDQPWSVRGDNIFFKAWSWLPLRWQVYHGGDARLDIRGPRRQRWMFDVNPLKLDGTIRFKLGGDINTANLVATRVTPKDVIRSMPPIKNIERIDLSLKDIGDDARFKFHVKDIYLAAEAFTKIQSVLGPRIRTLSFNMTAQGLDTINHKGWTLFSQNGTFRSDDLMFEWDALKINGRFDLAKSSDGLTGQITIALENTDKILERFQTAKIITANQRSQILFGLTLAPKNALGQKEITLNIRNNSVLMLGQTVYKF